MKPRLLSANPSYILKKILKLVSESRGSMGKLVNPFASHAKDPQFEPGWNHFCDEFLRRPGPEADAVAMNLF